MSRLRTSSYKDLYPSATTDRLDDIGLEGISANVKLLLKLIQDHTEASTKDNDDRKEQRMAGMMMILDDVKTRIQKSQSVGKKREAELRRCKTELRPREVPKDRTSEEPVDERKRLHRELNACSAARKSLEAMCSCLGKEKEIMASELARKEQEMNEMEELINDLKAQNETLSAKVKACATAHKEKRSAEGETAQSNASATLLERNSVLSEQLLKLLDGYRSLKRKFKEAQEENAVYQATLKEMELEVTAGLNRIRSFQQQMTMGKRGTRDIEEEISAMEHMFECFGLKISKHERKKSECVKPKAAISSRKASAVA